MKKQIYRRVRSLSANLEGFCSQLQLKSLKNTTKTRPSPPHPVQSLSIWKHPAGFDLWEAGNRLKTLMVKRMEKAGMSLLQNTQVVNANGLITSDLLAAATVSDKILRKAVFSPVSE